MRLQTTSKAGFGLLTASVFAVLAPVAMWAADPPASIATPTAVAVAPDYRIGPGDVIYVSVYHEPEASVGSVLVRSDGKISLPLLDDVYIEGMTTGEVKQALTTKLTPLIPSADVTVGISQSHSKRVYLDGHVKKIGPIDMTGPMTILQALNIAGGFDTFAKVNKISILRTVNGGQMRIPFDYNAVVKNGQPQKDIPLQAGDYIYVP
jgi:polysaccharide export outer membrane protein